MIFKLLHATLIDGSGKTPLNEADGKLLSRATLNPWLLLAAMVAATLTAVAAAIMTQRGGDNRMLVNFLCSGREFFDDYFKYITSFPGGAEARPASIFGVADLTIDLPADNPYKGVEGLATAKHTHLHGTPLMTLFCLVTVRAMRVLGGGGCFVLTCTAIIFHWLMIAKTITSNQRDNVAWTMLGLFSYPFVLMIARGNVYAGITAMLLIHAMLLAARRQVPLLAAILLAIAVNIRPNAILFAVPLCLFYRQQLGRVAFAFCLAGGIIGLASLMMAHQLYPDYTLHNFARGLSLYYRTYVVGDAGFAQGSSLYGALKFFLGYRPGLDTVALLPSVAVLLAGAWGWASGRLSDAAMLFMTSAAYCLGSSVIADYHLLVFVIPPMIVRLERFGETTTMSPADHIATVASWLMLIPKNFAYRENVSFQVVLNPAILLLAAIWLMMWLWASPRAISRSAGPSITGRATSRAYSYN